VNGPRGQVSSSENANKNMNKLSTNENFVNNKRWTSPKKKDELVLLRIMNQFLTN